MPQTQQQSQTQVPYTTTVKWVKTTPHGVLAPSWSAYFKAEQVAILSFVPRSRIYGYQWRLYYDGRLAKQVLRLSDNVWVYVPTMTLAKQRVAALVALLPN